MRFCLALLVLLAGSCGSTAPSRFYLLSPMESGARGEELDVSIEIASVELARYLAVPTIVTRTSANELELAEYDRWAEPLEEGFARCLAANLALLVPTRRVTRAPWERSGTPDVVLRVAVDRFDVEAGRVVLSARWSLTSPARGGDARVDQRTLEMPVDGDGYAAIARAMSRALGELSGQIADAVRKPIGP
jgi:uncharacterized lipoprotein YmbA